MMSAWWRSSSSSWSNFPNRSHRDPPKRTRKMARWPLSYRRTLPSSSRSKSSRKIHLKQKMSMFLRQQFYYLKKGYRTESATTISKRSCWRSSTSWKEIC
jgi:hypothetical protein